MVTKDTWDRTWPATGRVVGAEEPSTPLGSDQSDQSLNKALPTLRMGPVVKLFMCLGH